MNIASTILIGSIAATSGASCRFAKDYTSSDFKDANIVKEYLNSVATWEGNFAQPGVGYDPKSGYTYDGHPLNYETGELYGEPHLFSAPSKESIHLGVLALAIDGNEHALTFTGGRDKAIETLTIKMNGYSQFNETYPGYGCFTVRYFKSLLIFHNNYCSLGLGSIMMGHFLL